MQSASHMKEQGLLPGCLYSCGPSRLMAHCSGSQTPLPQAPLHQDSLPLHMTELLTEMANGAVCLSSSPGLSTKNQVRWGWAMGGLDVQGGQRVRLRQQPRQQICTSDLTFHFPGHSTPYFSLDIWQLHSWLRSTETHRCPKGLAKGSVKGVKQSLLLVGHLVTPTPQHAAHGLSAFLHVIM